MATALPQARVATKDVAVRIDRDPAWIVKRTGVESRRRARSDERLDDLAAQASLEALRKAGRAPTDVDLVLVATMTPDDSEPHVAPLVIAAIGATNAGAIDVGAACSGFVSALMLAVSHIESGRATCVIVVGGDFMSRVVDPTDPVTAGIFGDGVGAVVVERIEDSARFGPFVMGADGGEGDAIVTPRPHGPVQMDGHRTFRRAVDTLVAVAHEAVERAGTSLDEIDLAVLHQANRRITHAVSKRLDLPPERVVDCIAQYGNTTAGTIPIALAHAEEAGQLRPGTRVLLATFGAGLTWTGVVVTWGR